MSPISPRKTIEEHANIATVLTILAILLSANFFIFNTLNSEIRDTETDLKGKIDDLQDQVGRLQNQMTWMSHTNEAEKRPYSKNEILKGVGEASVDIVFVENNYIGYPIHFENKVASENLIRMLWESFKKSGFQAVGGEPKLIIDDAQNMKLLYPRSKIRPLENEIDQNLKQFFEWIEYSF